MDRVAGDAVLVPPADFPELCREKRMLVESWEDDLEVVRAGERVDTGIDCAVVVGDDDDV